MAQREFPISWLGVYRATTRRFISTSGNTLYVGGTNDDNTYIGIPTSVRDALKSSKTTPKLYFKMNVTDGAEFDFGGHKETYNKASGTMPWYRYLGLHPIYSTGWKTTDLTSAFMNDYIKGNYHGIVLYGSRSNKGEAHGRTGNSNQAVFVVEGTWNEPPSPPSGFTNPKSSTVAEGVLNVSWTAGSDKETPVNQLRYEVSYYNGSSWSETWTTGAGTLSWNYPMSDKPETSQARFRVRSIDAEGGKSDWTYSPYFTVSHNRPPEKPSNMSPIGGKIIDRTQTLRATWRHNDIGPQAGFRVQWRTVSSNGTKGSWQYVPSSTGFVNSISQYYDFAPNTFPLGEIEWAVTTKDQQGENSPLSSFERFVSGVASDAPIWMTPKSGSVVNSSELIASWSSVDQNRYELELRSSSNTVLWSESAYASNKSTKVGYSLENNKSYSLRLRVVDSKSGLWSSWSTVNFTTQFIPPSKPVLTAISEDEEGNSLNTITLQWVNDSPASQTPTVFVQVFRREYNATTVQPWVAISDSQAPNSSMVDYSPTSGVTYEYMVRAWGANDTYSESSIVESSIQLELSFLHRAASLSDLLILEVEDRTQALDLGGQRMQFANRRKPIFEFGFNELNEVPISFYLDNQYELRNALEFLRRRETFLYRDNVGRKFYCVLDKVNITDLAVNGFSVEVTLLEVDYEEEKGG